MKSSKDYLLLVLFLTTIAGGVLAWRQYNELVELRAAAMNNNERADLQKRLWEAEKNRKALEEKVSDLEHREPSEPGAPAPDRAAGRRNNRGPGDRASEFMALMEKPEMQRLVALERKGALDSRYAPLFKNLNLTPEQLDKFKNLLVEKQTSMMDVAAAARAQGLNPRTDAAAYRQMISDAQSEIDASIKTTLGDAAFSQYQTYEQTQPQRNTVSQLEQRLSYTATPLTDAQSDQLVSILAANSASSSNNNNPTRAMFGGGNGPNSGTKITDATVTAAQGVLTAPQVTALQQLQQEQQAQAAMAKAMREQFGNGGQGGTTPTPAATPKTGGG